MFNPDFYSMQLHGMKEQIGAEPEGTGKHQGPGQHGTIAGAG